MAANLKETPTRVNIYLSEEEAKVYQSYAKLSGRSFSGFVIVAMKYFMEQKGEER